MLRMCNKCNALSRREVHHRYPARVKSALRRADEPDTAPNARKAGA